MASSNVEGGEGRGCKRYLAHPSAGSCGVKDEDDGEDEGGKERGSPVRKRATRHGMWAIVGTRNAAAIPHSVLP